MRGGVSLAVWIGGAVAELDLLRRASRDRTPAHPHTDQLRRDIYRALLRAARYDTVDIDILAGASAGGLNAVLYGLAQSVGRTIDWAETMWQEVGGLWDLLRDSRPADHETFRVPSLLRGDDYFYPMLDAALAGISNTAPGELSEYVSIDLSATLARRPSTNPITQRAVHFHFQRRPGDGSPLTDVPAPTTLGTAAGRKQLARLALAGRSTSSFPGAFEPAAIHTGRREVAGHPSMRTVFSESGERFDVIDGGIFDNVPIGRALAAIAAAPASAPTERRLVFLDPSPPPTPPSRESPDPATWSAAGWVSTIIDAIGLKVRTESAAEEIALIRRHNEAELAARGRLDALAAQLAQGGPHDPVLPTGRYAEFRATRDAQVLAQLLTRPADFLLRSTAPVIETEPLLDESTALDLEKWLMAIYRAGVPGVRLDTDATAVLDTARLFVAWAWEIEELFEQLGKTVPDEVGRAKAALYRIAAAARHVRDLSYTSLVGTLRTPAEVPSRLLEALATAHLQQRSYGAADPLDRLIGVRDDQFWRALSTLGYAPPPTARLLDSLWDQLDGVRQMLREPTAAVADQPGQRRWQDSLFRMFYRPPLADVPCTRLHTVQAAAGAVPGSASMIRYHQITGSQRSPLHPLLTRTCDAARRDRVTRVLRDADLTIAETLDRGPLVDAQTKLAGNSLGNFSGFLDAGWRRHDWLWGRLDAAAGIVDMLLDGHADPQQLPHLWTRYVQHRPPGLSGPDWAAMLGAEPAELDTDPDEIDWSADAPSRGCLRAALSAWLQYALLVERNGHEGSLEAVVAAADQPKARIADLAPGYRFGVVSRLAHVAYRAVWPQARWSWRNLVVYTLLLVARPVLMSLPLLAAPLRLAVVLVLLAWLAPLPLPLPTGTPDPAWLALTAWAVLALTLGVTACRLTSARGRWRRLAEGVGQLPEWPELIAAWGRGRRRFCGVGARVCGVSALVATGLLAIGWPAAAVGQMPVFRWTLPTSVAVLAVVATTQAAVQGARRAPAPARRRRANPAWVAVALGFAVIAVAPLHELTLRWATERAGLPPTALAAAAALVIAMVMHASWANRGQLAIAVGAIGAVAGVLAYAGWDPAVATVTAAGLGISVSTRFITVHPRPGDARRTLAEAVPHS